MRHGHACVSVALIASLCSLVSLQGSQPLGDLPFQLVQQHLIVSKGSIGGLQGLNLLIDTGTIPSMLDKRIAGKLGCTPNRPCLRRSVRLSRSTASRWRA